ncbi:MAG: S8 family serine peptidase, partial [Rhodospirillaceae bacterium]|nr:S8 family serine peptidase [Rhodospirillaceae bacterium]
MTANAYRFATVLCLAVFAAIAPVRGQEARPAWLQELEPRFETAEKISVLIRFHPPAEPATPPSQPSPELERRQAIPGSPGSVSPESAATQAAAAARVRTKARDSAALTAGVAAQDLEAQGIRVRDVYTYQPIVLAEIGRDDLNKLAARADVASVYDNIYIEIAPPDPAPRTITPLDAAPDRERPQLLNTVPLVNAEKAWAHGYRGQGQAIVIIDNGINAGHAMFRGKIAAEACFSNAGLLPGLENLCPEGRQSVIGPGAASFCPGAKAGTYGVCDHGSHVAGIAAGDNAAAAGRLRGIAPEAKLIPVQVFTRTRGCPDCLGARSYTNYCAGYAMESAIQTLRDLRVLTAVAAGNDGAPNAISYPACIRDAVSVGSIGLSARPSTFSNASSLLDLYAPGERVRSAVHGAPEAYDSYSGTSMSTPHVAGAVAVLKSKLPTATADQLEYALKSSGIAVTSPSWSWTNPRIDVGAAVDVVGIEPPPPGVSMMGLFPGARTGVRSMVRILNPNYNPANTRLTLVQDNTRKTLGTYGLYTQSYGAAQVFVKDMEAAIRAEASADSFITLHINAPHSLYVQHILTDASGQTISNMTACTSTKADPGTHIGHVHTQMMSDSPSHIVVSNASPLAQTIRFYLYNSSGTWLGETATPAIPGNTTMRLPVQPLFDGARLAAVLPPGGVPRNLPYVTMVALDKFNGMISHTVDQTRPGIVV